MPSGGRRTSGWSSDSQYVGFAKGGTFDSYTCDVFMHFLSHCLAGVKRIDVIWDRYLEESLKQTTRNNRGSGIRLKVTEHGRLLKNWNHFCGVMKI